MLELFYLVLELFYVVLILFYFVLILFYFVLERGDLGLGSFSEGAFGYELGLPTRVGVRDLGLGVVRSVPRAFV